MAILFLSISFCDLQPHLGSQKCEQQYLNEFSLLCPEFVLAHLCHCTKARTVPL